MNLYGAVRLTKPSVNHVCLTNISFIFVIRLIVSYLRLTDVVRCLAEQDSSPLNIII